MLSKKEILILLDKLYPGPGYSSDPEIAALQGKLSIMLHTAE